MVTPAEKALEDVERRAKAANTALEKIIFDLDAEQRAIESETISYNTACRDHASGKDADPASILASIDRRKHKTLGLQQLRSEAEAKWQTLAAELQTAQLIVVRERDAAELARLTAVEVEAANVLKAAKEKFDTAARAHGDAAWALTNFRTSAERRNVETRKRA